MRLWNPYCAAFMRSHEKHINTPWEKRKINYVCELQKSNFYRLRNKLIDFTFHRINLCSANLLYGIS